VPDDAPQIRPIATNRKARHDYHIEETYEAGVSLVGSEVKTLRGGKASLQDAYATIRDGEVFLVGVHIPEYPQASAQNHEPTRIRKLLLHREEIRRLVAKTTQKGLTLIPLRLYFKGNKVKAEIALARGKRSYDKRRSIAEREAKREMAKREGSRRRGEKRR
jgi:SsrA-binding protein